MATFSTNPLLPNDWQIVGTPLNDTLDGGINYTTVSITYTELYGGLGNDLYLIDASSIGDTDRVVELLNGGIDTVTLVNTWFGVTGYWTGTSTYVMPDNVENLNVMGADIVVSASSLVAPFTNFIIDKTFNAISIYGNALGNNIVTGNGNDTIYGGLGNDTMAGGTGSDTYYVDATTDVIIESSLPGLFSVSAPGGVAGILGGANDTVYSTATYTLGVGLERLYLDHAGGNINGTGNAQANTIYGNAGNNNLQGMAGNDTLYGGGGKDTIAGGDGDDLIVNSNSYANNAVGSITTVYFDPTLGASTIAGAAAPSNIDGGGGNDTIWGANGDTVLGGAGNDILYGDLVNNVLTVEKITLSGGEGNDVFMNFGKGDSVAGGGGIDTAYADFTAWGNSGFTLAADLERAVQTATTAVKLTGNALDNYLQGNTGADSLVGGAGQDVLDGHNGADTMIGGDGNDSYMVDNIGDVVLESSTVAGGDTVHFFGSANFKSYALGANVENLVLMDGNYTPTGSAANASTLNGKGNALANLMLGNANANLLEGAAGNDTLNGGVGADTLIGGSDNDVYFADNSGDVIQELADFVTSVGVTTTVKGGLDTVFLLNDISTGTTAPAYFNGTAYVMARNLENLDASAITSAGSSVPGGFAITGNESANKIVGSRLNDTITGGAGNDTMDGGLGNDTYYVTDSGDLAAETIVGAAAGTADTVMFRASLGIGSYTMGGGIENLVVQGGSVGKIIGNLADNVITGNGAGNVIDGGAGNDTLYGNFGDDSLIGGLGRDTLDGGYGNDTLDGGGDNDTYIVDSLSDKIVDSAGTDTVRTNLASYDLSAIIVGGLNSGSTPGTGGTLENLTFTGTGSFNANGNALANSITGGGASDVLAGYAGNDTLDGGAGADLMQGGTGNDTYNVDSAGDVIQEDTTASGGNDTVVSKVSFDLNSAVSGGSVIISVGGAQKGLVENLTLVSTVTGGAGTNLMGNELANILTGNELNNIIDGGAGRNLSGVLATSISGGADSMIGGDGNDTYFVDNIGDKITELASAPSTVVGAIFSATAGNADEIYATLANGSSFSMLASAINVERLHILDNPDIVNGGAPDNVNVIGNVSDNIIWGGLGNNNIDGGAGSDIVTGGAGNDTLLGGDGDDVLDGDGLYQDSYMGAWIDANLSAGKDSMSGGNGNDIFYVNIGDGAGTVTGGIAQEDVVSDTGTTGKDTVKLVGSTITNYTLDTGIENLNASGLANSQTAALASATWSGGTATIVTSTAHNLATGASTTVAGVTVNTGYNGIYTITVLNATTFTYALVVDPGSAGTTTGATVSPVILRLAGNAVDNDITGLAGAAYEEVVSGGDGNDIFRLTPTNNSFDTVRGGLDSLVGGGTVSSDIGKADVIIAKPDASAGSVSASIDAKGIEAVVLDVSNNANGFTWTTTFSDASNFTQTPSTVPGGIAPTITITGGVTGGQATSSDISGISVAGDIILTGLGGGDTALNKTGPTYVLANYSQNNSLAVTTTLTLADASGSTDSLRVLLDNHKSGGLKSLGVEKLFVVSKGDVLNNAATANVLDVSLVTKSAGGMADIDVTGDSSLQLRGLLNNGVVDLHDFSAQFFDMQGAATETLNLNNVETKLVAGGITTLNLVVTNSTLGGIGSVINAANATLATTTAVSGTGNLTLNNFTSGTLNANGSGELTLNAVNAGAALALTASNGNLNINVGGTAQTDSYSFGTSLNSLDSITDADAGGTDTLSATLDGLDVFSGQLRIAGVETLNFITSAADGLVDAQFITGANTLNVTVAGGTSLTVQNLDVGTVTASGSAGDLAVYLNSNQAHTVTGGNGNDTISGGDLSDTVTVTAGNDFVATNGGNDTVSAGASLDSSDTIDGGDGTDRLNFTDNGAGTNLDRVTNIETIVLGAAATVVVTQDSLVAAGATLTVSGGSSLNWDGSLETDGHFSITGTTAADTIIGGGGNDTIFGGAGTDSVTGGGGNDAITMLVQAANISIIDGGAGTDTLVLSGTAITGTATMDLSITSGDQLTALNGAAEGLSQGGFENLDASLVSGFGVVATAAAGGSIIIGSDAADTITGGAGNDNLTGNNGADSIDGGSGDDTILGGAGADTVSGGAGSDVITMGTGSIDAAYGDDVAGTNSSGYTDTLKLTGTTNTNTTIVDLSVTGTGDQISKVNGTNDAIVQTGFENFDASGMGGSKGVVVTAAASGSIIIGGGAKDTITGGAGADTLTGNAGNDTFVFDAPLAPGNVDTITDFTSGSDVIELDHLLFESLTTNISGATISNAEFAAGANLTSSGTEGTVLLYNWTTGGLYYDADANGSGAGELIAVLGNAPGLVASDIHIM